MENNFNQYLIEQLIDNEIDCSVAQFKKSQEEYYKICHNNCDLEAGNEVKVTRSWTVNECYTPILCIPEVSYYIGKTLKIKEKCNFGYKLDSGIHVPYFVLEKVKEEFIPLDYNDDLVGKVVKHKNANYKQLIIGQNKDTIFISTNYNEVYYRDLMLDYTFQDGLPCHKLKQ